MDEKRLEDIERSSWCDCAELGSLECTCSSRIAVPELVAAVRELQRQVARAKELQTGAEDQAAHFLAERERLIMLLAADYGADYAAALLRELRTP